MSWKISTTIGTMSNTKINLLFSSLSMVNMNSNIKIIAAGIKGEMGYISYERVLHSFIQLPPLSQVADTNIRQHWKTKHVIASLI